MVGNGLEPGSETVAETGPVSGSGSGCGPGPGHGLGRGPGHGPGCGSGTGLGPGPGTRATYAKRAKTARVAVPRPVARTSVMALIHRVSFAPTSRTITAMVATQGM